MPDKKIKLDFETLKTSVNLNEELTADQSAEIGNRVVRDYENDKRTRGGWEKRNETAMKLALQVVEKKNTPWENASNVKFPLLSHAALQFQVRAFGQLVTAPNLVKMRVTGNDPEGAKAARASRVGEHMSYQNLDEDEEWEEGFDRLLMVLPIMGLCYRKKFWDSTEQRLKTTTVLPQDLIVPYRATSLDKMPRKTEVFELYDREIRERQLAGLYSEPELGQAEIEELHESDKRDGISPDIQDKDRPRKMLEQHLFMDLDGDGYKEPYIVTVDKSSEKVLRIVQRFRKIVSEQSMQAEGLMDEIKALRRSAHELAQQAQQAAMQMQESGQVDPNITQQFTQQVDQIEQEIDVRGQQIKELSAQTPNILRIDPVECYTKYGFIPAPDGSFYDIGFGSLLSPLNGSVNTLINQLIDSGTLQNSSSGFLGRGARIKGGKVQFKPNEWKRVNSTGAALKESIVPLPVQNPSPVLFNLLGLLIEYTQQLSSVNDAMSGKDMGQNTPAYNMEAMLQQGMQVFSGIFKRVYRSLRHEFKEQYRLNAMYLNPEEYYETIDGNAKILQSDYTGDAKDLYPAADPNAFSQMEKMAKAQFLAQRSMSVPGYDPTKVELRMLEAMDIEDRQEIFPVDETGQPQIPPPPNQEFEVKIAEEERRTVESKVRAEVSLIQAENDTILKEAQVMKLAAEAKAIGDDGQVKAYDAITKRLKVKQESIKQKLEELESGTTKREGTE